MIISQPKTSLAGTFYIEIDDGDAINVVNVEIQDFGDITYEFDLVPTQQTDARVGGIAGAMTIQIWDGMSNTSSFYDVMEQYIGLYNVNDYLQVPKSNVNLVWNAFSSNTTYIFPFDLYFSDIGIDERSGRSTIKLSPKKSTLNIKQWGEERAPLYLGLNEVPYSYAAMSYFMNGANTVLAGTAISDVVGTLGQGVATVNIYETAKNIGEAIVTSSKYGTVTQSFDAFPNVGMLAGNSNGMVVPHFVFSGVTSTAYDQNKPMIEIVQQYAGMEGAIFGSGFNVNFYINRTTNTYNVEITNDEIIDLSFVTVPRAYNSVVYQTPNVGFVDGIPFATGNTTISAWKEAPQQQKFAFSNLDPYLLVGCIESGVEFGYTYISNTGPITANIAIRNLYQDSLFLQSYRGFAGALGITTTNRSAYRIDLDVMGADKIRPYEVIKFDNTVPIRYQGKHFRPTSLAYDLKSDRVRVTAYQIDTTAFPEPPEPNIDTNVNVNIFVCESGLYMASINIIATNTYSLNTIENGSYMMFGLNTWTQTDDLNVTENGTNMVENLVASSMNIFMTSYATSEISNINSSEL